jgi:hypothetical protein
MSDDPLSSGRPVGAVVLGAWTAGTAAAAVALFACYLRQSRTVAAGSDGASQALQAWDLMHGNLLLHGWWLTDVSFRRYEASVGVAALLAYPAALAVTALLRAAGSAGLSRSRTNPLADQPRIAYSSRK